MIYTSLKVGDKIFNLRITRQSEMALKAKTGKSILKIMESMQDDQDIEPMLTIFLCACKWEKPEMTIEDVYDIWNEFVDEGYAIEELLALTMEIFRVSGYVKKIDSINAEILKAMGIEVPQDKIGDIEIPTNTNKKKMKI